MYKSII